MEDLIHASHKHRILEMKFNSGKSGPSIGRRSASLVRLGGGLGPVKFLIDVEAKFWSA